MLYDPKWEKQTKPAVRSLAGFIAWLEQQQPDTQYQYTRPDRCAVAQYLKAAGEENYSLKAEAVHEMLGDGRIVNSHPETFGAALERARAFARASAKREGN